VVEHADEGKLTPSDVMGNGKIKIKKEGEKNKKNVDKKR